MTLRPLVLALVAAACAGTGGDVLADTECDDTGEDPTEPEPEPAGPGGRTGKRPRPR